ncbi:MAG: hypothetical protein ACO1OQ_00010 [Rufibacter sp.]
MKILNNVAKVGIKVSLKIFGGSIGLLLLLWFLLSVPTASPIHILLSLTIEDMFLLLFTTIAISLWGALAGCDILSRNKNKYLIGLRTSFMTFLTVVLFHFFIQFLNNSFEFSNPFAFQNLRSSIIFLLIIWFIPLLIIGSIIGKQIKRHSVNKY